MRPSSSSNLQRVSSKAQRVGITAPNQPHSTSLYDKFAQQTDSPAKDPGVLDRKFIAHL